MGDGEWYPGEVSPVNPAAVRGLSGIWNEETLPVMEWEVPERRIVVPPDLHLALGMPVPVVRVARSVQMKIIGRHANVLDDYWTLEIGMDHWQAYRFKTDRWEIYLPTRDDGTRVMAVIGPDNTGSWNLISLYLVRPRNWQNRKLIWRRK